MVDIRMTDIGVSKARFPGEIRDREDEGGTWLATSEHRRATTFR